MGKAFACEKATEGEGGHCSNNPRPSIRHDCGDLIPPSMPLHRRRHYELHLEVKALLSRIKNKFPCADPMVKGGISQVEAAI